MAVILEETEHGFRARLPAPWSRLGLLFDLLAGPRFLLLTGLLLLLLLPFELEVPVHLAWAAALSGGIKLVTMGLSRWLDSSTTVEVALGQLELHGPFGVEALPLHAPVEASHQAMGRCVMRFGRGEGAFEVATTLSPAQAQRFLVRLQQEQEEHGAPDAMPQALRQLQSER